MQFYFLVLLSITICLPSVAISAPDESNSPFEKTMSCFRKPFSTYEEWLTMIRTGSSKRFAQQAEIQKSVSNFKERFPESLYEQYKQTISCETFLYKSDAGLVEGFLIRPKSHKEKLPVIIYNRGGNGNYGRVNMARMFATLFPLAKNNFIVIGSQYRGSNFKGDPLFNDEFGGKDVHDVVNLANLIPKIERGDHERVGMFGSSRGAMQSYLSIKEGVKVKALVTIAGNADLMRGLEFRPEMETVYKNRIPNYFDNKSAELRSRSALSWIDKLSVDFPILLIHGEKDVKVEAFQSIEMAKKLEELKIPHKLVIYPDDNHDLTINHGIALQEVNNWFKKYL